jgi:hypothetical protein
MHFESPENPQRKTGWENFDLGVGKFRPRFFVSDFHFVVKQTNQEPRIEFQTFNNSTLKYNISFP